MATFRQGDSIPKAVLEEWQEDRRRFHAAHGISEDACRQPEAFSRIYQQIPEGVRRAFEREEAHRLHLEVDKGHGSCRLRDPSVREELAKSLRHFHGIRLWLGDYVIMPNHVHAIMTPIGSHALEDILGSIKKWVSRKIGARIHSQDAEHSSNSFWQQESYERIIRDEVELARFREYIARNPLEAKLPSGSFTYQAAEWLDAFATRAS